MRKARIRCAGRPVSHAKRVGRPQSVCGGPDRVADVSTAPVRAALTASFERYGVPAALLMDHGAPWWASRGPAGLTTLGVFLLKQGIRLIFSAIRHPQTQGKVERFHRTLGERLRWSGVPTRWRASAGARRLSGGIQRGPAARRPRAEPPGRAFHPSPHLYTPRPDPGTIPPTWPCAACPATG